MKAENWLLFWTSVLGIAALAGCSRDRYMIGYQAVVMSPQPPPILTTPAVYLLTNTAGYFSNVKLEEQRGASSGRLCVRGARLFYAPTEKQRETKHGPVGGFSFIWDATKNSGYVLSEALQGYAPISHTGAGAVTNVVMEGGNDSRTVTAQLANGTSLKFEAAVRSGQEGMPGRIVGGSPPFNAAFEKVQSEAPPLEMFKVPDGFTSYASAEAMVDEISLRHRNLKRKY